jgi:hypothetical protein
MDSQSEGHSELLMYLSLLVSHSLLYTEHREAGHP